MLSAENNQRLTRTGPDTPAGRLMRRYWQPAALAEELTSNRPLVPVRLLGEDLILWRDDAGRITLMDRHCPHRGVDLCYGRLEDGGLRCPFHGWLFDAEGHCLETPAEPEGSRLFEKVRQTAYPCVEKNGMIFAWMGAGNPPPFPELDCFRAPDSHVFAFKGLWDCNWLQALEVGIDPAHASWLHRFLEDENPDQHYGKQFRDRAAGTDMTLTEVLRRFPNPEIRVEEAPHGLRIMALRDLGDGSTHVRITNQIFPHGICIPMSAEMHITQWHVPVDDETCYWYALFTSFTDPVDKDLMRAQRLESCTLPDYRPRLGKHNNYGFDADEQSRLTYTGMGMDINVHDQWAVESMGPIQDRTREYLGASDKAITAYRKILRQAIDDNDEERASNGGHGLPNAPTDEASAAQLRGPAALDAIGSDLDCWKAKDAERREGAPWDAAM